LVGEGLAGSSPRNPSSSSSSDSLSEMSSYKTRSALPDMGLYAHKPFFLQIL
jgi:hypothetical protein